MLPYDLVTKPKWDQNVCKGLYRGAEFKYLTNWPKVTNQNRYTYNVYYACVFGLMTMKNNKDKVLRPYSLRQAFVYGSLKQNILNKNVLLSDSLMEWSSEKQCITYY